MLKITSFTNNAIEGNSFYFEEKVSIDLSVYDLVVVASSWDPRCLNLITSTHGTCENGILFAFDDKDEFGLREAHDVKLKEWFEDVCCDLRIISGLSTNVYDSFFSLFEVIISLSVKVERPISVLFDLSTCPRYISLSAMTKGFSTSFIKNIDYFYGECLYPDPQKGIFGVEEIVFTSGEWKTEPLAHCIGEFDPSRKMAFTVSIGFEGNKILRVLNVEDPNLVKVLVPDPGFVDAYVKRVLEANSELLKSYDITATSIIKASAGDAIHAWKKLDSLQVEITNKLNLNYLCAGTKPHSLGMALSALSSEKVSVLYSLPKEHTFVRVIPANKYWLYKITNLAIPSV